MRAMGLHRNAYAFPTLLLLLLSIGPSITLSQAEPANAAAPATKSFPITTLINAKWSQTPLHLEIAEYLADENAGHYWDFIDGLAALEMPLNVYDTESKQYNAAIQVARHSLSSMQLPLLKLVVAMHSLTPRIQTHFQLANEALGYAGGSKCSGSAAFVQIGSQLACDLAAMKQQLARPSDPDTLDAAVETYSFDHIYPGSENISRTAVLYGDVASNEFASCHKYLVEQAAAGKVRYIARHYLAKQPERRVRLSGYGVELHLKSTEYKSQDDSPKPGDNEPAARSDEDAARGGDDDSAADNEVHGFDFRVLKQRHPSLAHSLDKFRQSLLQGSDEIVQLKAWEFQDLGLQAAAAIAAIKGEEALQIMQFTAQNFPMQTRALLGQKVSDELRDEVKHNTEVLGRSLNIVPPDGALFVNGLFFDADTMDLGALVETLRSEVRVMEALEQNNVRGPVATALLGLDLSATGGREFAIDIRDTAIVWVNNIETDPQYRRWPSSVMDLLRPTFPGMLRNIRKNVFNLVVVVDPVEPGRTRDLLKMAESFIVHNAPVRLGLVFDGRKGEDSAAEEVYLALACVFNYVTQQKDARYALNFLNVMYAEMAEGEPVKVGDLRSNLKASFKSLTNKQFDEIIEEGSAYDYGRQLAQEFVERIGFASAPQVLLNGVPMQSHLLESDSDFEETVFSDILQQTTTLQKAVYREELTDSEDILDYLMNQPHVMPRLNQRILSTENNKYLDLSGTPNENLGNVKGLAQLSNRDMTATLLHNIKYFGGKHATERIGNAELHFLTIWVFGDLEEASGRDALAQALKYVKAGSSVRVAFIPNTEGVAVGKKDNLNRLVWAASQTLGPIEATDVVLKWLKQWPQPPKDIPEPVFEVLLDTELHMKMLRVYAQRVLELRKSEVLIVGNGKIYGPLNKDEKFSIDDFGLIDRLSTFQYGDKIRKVLKKTASARDVELHISSDILLKLYSSLLSRQSKTRFKLPVDLKGEHSLVQLEAKRPELPQIEITAVIDPASRSAQRVAPVLVVLRQILNCRMSVYLTPVSQHSDMPVKNFYRYVVEPEVNFEPNGRMAEGPYAKFTGVPANPLLTQNLQVPDNWLVEAVRAVYDLDNIKLSEIGGPVHSEYELEYLLLEGHCFDAANGSPPRGLQVTLGTKERPVMVDTIVMANLGYFQLKANPGAWELRLRDGKSADIYDITYAEGPNTVHYNHTTKVVISSLRSHVIKLRVSKKPGKLNADLLSEEDDQGGSSLWNSIASSFGGGGGSEGGGDDDNETINIFSVASGHLYERLLRIMMVSLLKHTKSPVKFWFLKNYLSPQFNDLLPHMAREYGFQYELVQYKWPRWLHQQTEKQRIIWGYKILFLDVLFPLNVRKIIFVDADAIVRADIKELYDMDLGGAPYAYTPFCDSRKEMEGFRFWKQGYWRNHLMGRHYHISALYVVDLKRFRRIAAGDRLRGQYQALSQDPNSLSNLDQDLPNNMIHQVAIKSLPSEWLWCQTWCSDKSFKTAKVIDLCNNPMTKEAKLTAAQRIVPEWKDYDAEIKRLQAKIEDHENSEYHEATITAKEGERVSKEVIQEEEDEEDGTKTEAAKQKEHGASQHSEL